MSENQIVDFELHGDRQCLDSAVGRIGQLACWEHYMPLARYALITDAEQLHSAAFIDYDRR
jgi:hypothetical protein